ncbi:MAG: transposase, partial [Acidobacteriota bacterium]
MSSRSPRYIPPGWSVEVSTSTVCGFFMLPVTSHFRRIFVGILGRAQEQHPVKIHAVVATSNHYHMILTPEDAEQLADFMEFVNGNLAREAARTVGWRGSFWRERYHLIPISPEPEALVGRLRYVLSNTVKEFLIERVGDWDGLHSGIELMEGKPMKGVWYDRSKEYEARRQAKRKAARRGKPAEPISRGAFMEHYEVKLA